MMQERFLLYKGARYRLVTASGAEQEVEALMLALLPGSEFAHKSFAVGGYVRDEIMGLESKDLDIVVSIPDGARKLSTYLHDKFPKETSNPYQLGKGYPIWHIAFKTDAVYKGKQYHTEGAELDFADSQKEAFPDPTSRQRITEFGTIEEDMERRDFTVNMLMKDLTNGKIVDLSGTGVDDIKAGVLRIHPNVPIDRPFADDPLRMLRLIRFMVKYDWDIDPDTKEAVARNAHRIEIVSGERVRDELIKIMKLGKLAPAIRFMEDTGLLQYVLPEVQALRGVEQAREHHAEGDVFEHTMLVLENAKPTVEAQLAALLHDTGKPATQKFLEEKIQFLGHEVVSAQIAEAFMRRLRFDGATIAKIVALVRNHMRPHTSRQWGVKALRKFIRELGDHVEDLLDLAEADSLGSRTPEGGPAKGGVPELRERIKEIREAPIPVQSKPVLSGNEVMRILGLKPGREVGNALRWLQDKVDDYAAEGIELNPAEAKRLLLEDYKL